MDDAPANVLGRTDLRPSLDPATPARPRCKALEAVASVTNCRDPLNRQLDKPIYVNRQTGDRVVWHTVVSKTGRVIDDHPRPYYKAREGE
jgi:hypothetical protein